MDNTVEPLHVNGEGQTVYNSTALEKIWGLGHVSVGEVTFDSAAYVARYCTKKINGDLANEHYGNRQPEYATMSRREAIGRRWLEKYHSDVYPSNEVIHDGRKLKVPAYYDKWLEKNNPTLYDYVKQGREQKALLSDGKDSTPHRLFTKHQVRLLNSQKQRSLEGDKKQNLYDTKAVQYNKEYLT